MVITTPDLAPGFKLAGVETFAVENAEQAEAILTQLLAGDEASLVVVGRSLLQALSPRLKRQIAAVTHRGETHYHPVVMDFPDTGPTLSQETRRHQFSELMRRVIGFQITFTTD